MKVKVRNNNVDKALRVFKRKCNEVVFEYRERQFYEKPSTIKHRSKKAAIAREKKRQKIDRTD